jgi:predicted enzyme related to lactoylglutathione lyase
VRTDREEPAFEDGTGHVIGHFVRDQEGVRPYVFVERLDETLAAAVAQGGEVVTAPYAEGDLRVAVFRDPAENLIGVWERPG